MRQLSVGKSGLAVVSVVVTAGLVGTPLGAQETDAEGRLRCSVKDVKQMTWVADIGACEVVTVRMLEYLRRREDFGAILTGTSEACPALAGVPIDVPVASLAEELERRGGEGNEPGAGGGASNGGSRNGGSSNGGSNNGGSSNGGSNNGGSNNGGGNNGGGNNGGGQGGGEGDRNRGHGNDPGGYDPDNPGKSSGRQNGKPDDCE